MSARSEARWKQRIQTENNKQNALLGMIEGMALSRSPRAITPTATQSIGKVQVRRWMNAIAKECETMTELVEAANIALDLPSAWLDDETHWIWEIAYQTMEVKND